MLYLSRGIDRIVDLPGDTADVAREISFATELTNSVDGECVDQ